MATTKLKTGTLAVLGVEGDPRPDQLLGRLRAIRDKFPAAPADAADNAAPLYRALAAQVRGRGASRRTGSLNLGTLRTEFGRGDGLIATNVGWRRPPVVRRGPAVFGDMLPFVPAVEGTDPLWNALSVRPPTRLTRRMCSASSPGGARPARSNCW